MPTASRNSIREFLVLMHDLNLGGNTLCMWPAIMQLIARLSRSLAGGATSYPQDDSDLLGWFVRERDDAAFAAIIGRHGRLVWCVPRAASERNRRRRCLPGHVRCLVSRRRDDTAQKSMAPWLHATATRIAKKVRLAAARRTQRELHAATGSDVAIGSFFHAPAFASQAHTST